jgi:hypothetical protein
MKTIVRDYKAEFGECADAVKSLLRELGYKPVEAKVCVGQRCRKRYSGGTNNPSNWCIVLEIDDDVKVSGKYYNGEVQARVAYKYFSEPVLEWVRLVDLVPVVSSGRS